MTQTFTALKKIINLDLEARFTFMTKMMKKDILKMSTQLQLPNVESPAGWNWEVRFFRGN